MSLDIKYCPSTLKEGNNTYSNSALKKMFNSKKVSHILPFTSPDVEGEEQNMFIENRKRISISGVQEKLSVILIKNKLKLTEAGEQGQYILKPIPRDIKKVSQVPANEHLTMQIAMQVFGIQTAENALIFFNNDKPAYITKRFDVKTTTGKYLQEDFASLAGKTIQNSGFDFKYEYSYLEIGKLIKQYVNAYEVELEKFYKLVLFNYLFSNGDAHLKNFSLLETDNGDFILSPAYDLLCTRIHVNDSDFALSDMLSEESFEHSSFSSLGFHAYDDFFDFGITLGLNQNRIIKILNLMRTENKMVFQLINNSFLNEETKIEYSELYKNKLIRLNISISKKINN